MHHTHHCRLEVFSEGLNVANINGVHRLAVMLSRSGLQQSESWQRSDKEISPTGGVGGVGGQPVRPCTSHSAENRENRDSGSAPCSHCRSGANGCSSSKREVCSAKARAVVRSCDRSLAYDITLLGPGKYNKYQAVYCIYCKYIFDKLIPEQQ